MKKKMQNKLNEMTANVSKTRDPYMTGDSVFRLQKSVHSNPETTSKKKQQIQSTQK